MTPPLPDFRSIEVLREHIAQTMAFYDPVSYTHLDVYKRQVLGTAELAKLTAPELAAYRAQEAALVLSLIHI